MITQKLKILSTFACLLWGTLFLQAQVDARMLQNPDVSQTHITFVYAGDIWVVPKTGGIASKLSSPQGQESFPRFSPDGSKIAFSGNYDGNQDVYVIPSMGGIPKRVTHHGMADRVLDWTPTGDKILFASSRESGRQRYRQFYTASIQGGMAEKLPVPYGEFACYSPDGKKVAFTPATRSFRTWKRYRGGTAQDITIFNLSDYSTEKITNNNANDELPMWHKNKIYFLSDQGKNQRFNIWSYDLTSKKTKQITRFKDYDIHFPAIGPTDIVFEAGGKLYLMSLANEKYKEVKINVITDQMGLNPRVEQVSNLVYGAWISPDAKRVVVEARGELFSVPAEHGYVKNLTNSSGIAERYPTWSPNGKYIAYWSDRSGEYELTVKDMENPSSERKLTAYGKGFRYRPYWSPDSKQLAFIDQSMTLRVYNMETNTTKKVTQNKIWMNHFNLQNFRVSWSSDSRWLAYPMQSSNSHSAIFIYDTENNAEHQATSGYYSDANPSFDPEGKYLYFTTNRTFRPVYSDMDNSWVYPNSTGIAALCLRKDVPSPLAPRNDEVTIKEEKKEESKKEEKKEGQKKEEKAEGKKEGGKPAKADKTKKDKKKAVKIDFDDMERRVIILPAAPGNYNNVTAVKGKVIYQRFANSGSGDRKSPIMYFDLKSREEKTMVANANAYLVSADGKKALVAYQRNMAIVNIAPNQKMNKKLRLNEMEMTLDPKAEWKQIFNDAWRFERDFFYDPNMHGVDWDEMKIRYGKLIDASVTRSDVNFVLGELIGELNASHTYNGGGDTERAKRRSVGYLGINWTKENGKYKIGKIIKGAPWDAEVRSPLDMPGVDVKEGDYILAINGVTLDVNKDPAAALEGLAGKTVELKINRHTHPDSARTVIVKTLRSETRLRHLAWIEANRKRVEEATNGKVGYVYVRSTGIDGQNELVRQFMAQVDKEGMIIDERFNSGGQIPDRFIELLNRPALAFWAVRDGKHWQWPPIANFGPKVMLINYASGSGGDAFPDYFRKAGLGPLIGTRTWGGLIGISGAPALIDGGGVTVPTFRMYDPDGTWFKEGHGVDPDIEVPEDYTQLAKGVDPQLERGIQEVMKRLGKPAQASLKKPSAENRNRR